MTKRQAGQLRVPSCAKVNWILKVLGRREDGYHEVRTLYQTIDLQDQIHFQLTTDSRVTLDTEGRQVAGGEENLIVRSARLLEDRKAQPNWGAHIRLFKRIPVGAGLGGGSSNAAITLVALNQIWDCGLTRATLSRLAARLGSDVPFFLLGGTALGLGRGEQIIPLPTPTLSGSLLILYPGWKISSGAAYRLGGWDDWHQEGLTATGLETTIWLFNKAIRRLEQGCAGLENDFQAPLFRNYPSLEKARQRLSEAGCEEVIPCGSGSALLGWMPTEGVSDRMRGLVDGGCGGEVFPCRVLTQHEYENLLIRAGLQLGPNRIREGWYPCRI